MTTPGLRPAQGVGEYPASNNMFDHDSVFLGAANQSGLSVLSTSVDSLRAYAVVIGRSIWVDTLYVEATAVVAGAVGRVGIYRNTNDGTIYPSSLVVDSGEVALATAVVRSVGVDVRLSPGLYWLASVCGVAAPTLRIINQLGLAPLCGLSAAFVHQFGRRIAFPYAALPAAFPALAGFDTTQGAPAVGVQALEV